METAQSQPQPDIDENDAPAVAGALQEMLSEISDRVDLADRNYADIIEKMQSKLAALDTLAKTSRQRAEDTARREAEAEAARQAEAEAKLKAEAEAIETARRKAEEDAASEAARLAKAVEAAKAAASRAIEKTRAQAYPQDVDPFDVIDHAPARAREPWDTESADVFARHFEQFESYAPARAAARHLEPFHPSRPAPQPLVPAAEQPSDRTWLEGRFNDIAARISEMMAANQSGGLDARFDSLENRIETALTTVTTQATNGSDTLKQIETHIAEIDEHVDYIRNELSRLDSVEAQIRTLMERQKAIESKPAAPAPKNDADHAANAAGVAQLTELLQRLVSERQHTEEHTVVMLDTLQQAMIRVLDRIEAIETGHAEEVAAAEHAEPHDQQLSAPHAEPLAAHHIDEPAHVPAQAPDRAQQPADHAPVQQHVQAASAPTSIAPHDNFFIDFEDDIAHTELARVAQLQPHHHEGATPQELQSSIVQIRRNFIAEAERARMPTQPMPENGGNPPAQPAAQRPSARRPRSLLDKLMQPTSKQLAVAALGLMIPLNGMFLYLVMRPAASTPEQVSYALPPEEPAPQQPLDRHSEASQALASEPPISQPPRALETADRETNAFPTDSISLPAAVVATEMAEQGRIDLPPATVGPLTLRRAAAEGDPSAQFEVAARLAEGKGIDQNFKAAIQWYQRSASHGFAQAQYRLGTHYERGLGVDKDAARARIWYMRAAEQGNIKAMHNMAVISTNRTDAKPDYSDALRWFTEAAQYNLADSQFNLAVLYENGLGVEKDPKSAYFWFALAARNGDKEAIKRRETVKSQLSADALAAAENEVRSFQGKPQIALANDARLAGEQWKRRQSSSN